MPVQIFRPNVPSVGEPAKVLGLVVMVTVVCKQCNAGEQLALVNSQVTHCPSCGGAISVESVVWDKNNPRPKIVMSATRPVELPKI